MPGGVSERAVYQTNSLHLLTDHSGIFIGQQLLPITVTRRVLTSHHNQFKLIFAAGIKLIKQCMIMSTVRRDDNANFLVLTFRTTERELIFYGQIIITLQQA